MHKLTTKHYWEKFYKNSNIEANHIIKMCGTFDNIWDKMITSCKSFPKTIIEIGAYPGRYTAYLSAKYNIFPTALDFNSDQSKIESAFKTMGVNEFELIQDDFFKFSSDKKYDIVYSIGFIEHFENFDEVLDKHVKLMSPDGALLIMIPNKRYLRKVYGFLCDYANLKAHNLDCMSLDTFKNFAKRNKLQINYLDYVGGFPYKTHQKLNWFQLQLYRATKLVLKKINPTLSKYPSKYYSGTIVGVFSFE